MARLDARVNELDKEIIEIFTGHSLESKKHWIVRDVEVSMGEKQEAQNTSISKNNAGLIALSGDSILHSNRN